MQEVGHAVVVVAEGAGEELCGKSVEVDKGGNRKLPKVGVRHIPAGSALIMLTLLNCRNLLKKKLHNISMTEILFLQ